MESQQGTPSIPQKPKWDLPDIWAKSGHCPACGATNLKITHLPDYPDYLSCAHCQVSFEVENGGRHIRLKYIPDQFEYADAMLRGRWVAAADLPTILRKPQPVVKEADEPQLPKQPLSDAEIWKRAVGMYKLGNKPRMIQLTLMQSGVPQTQADAILEKLKRLAEEDTRKMNQKFWILAGVALLLIFSLAGGWLYGSGNLAVLMGDATPVPTQSGPSAVDLLLDLVPDEAKPAIIDLPKTSVDVGRGPGQASCPPTSGMAAELFGGDAAMWQQAGAFAAWQMIDPINSATITVPTDMTAAYVDNRTRQFLSVHGPATIYNVNFLVISC